MITHISRAWRHRGIPVSADRVNRLVNHHFTDEVLRKVHLQPEDGSVEVRVDARVSLPFIGKKLIHVKSRFRFDEVTFARKRKTIILTRIGRTKVWPAGPLGYPLKGPLSEILRRVLGGDPVTKLLGAHPFVKVDGSSYHIDLNELAFRRRRRAILAIGLLLLKVGGIRCLPSYFVVLLGTR